MPFLYLPDAVSLTLLLFVLVQLRRSACVHFQQELHRLRADLFQFTSTIDLRPAVPACVHLITQFGAAIEFAEKVSPARLWGVDRLRRKIPQDQREQLLPERHVTLEFLIQPVCDRKVREKLQRIQMEFNMTLGIYYLFASISGWILTISIMFRLIRRAWKRRPADRVDWFFDMMERTFIRQGRRARVLALLVEPK